MTAMIQVENLSKRYRIGKREEQHDTLISAFGSMLRSPINNLRNLRKLSRTDNEEESIIWALKNVSFEIEEGEVVGIIGRNGAGKSTLLKILSRVTSPTEGLINLNGRVGSLLEVGTGFHPELTGRENVYMNGTILGMTRREIDLKFDDIIDFSGVEKFIDTPIKRYSSGMQVRLAFAVAAHLEPEILIVDEVLSVGDAEFQRKSIGKMQNVSRQGRTVLFVSHNLTAVKALTHKCIYFRDGEIVSFGGTDEVIHQYSADTITVKGTNSYSIDSYRIPTEHNLGASFTNISVNNKSDSLHKLIMGEEVLLEIDVEASKDIGDVYINILLKDEMNRHVTFITSLDKASLFNVKKGSNKFQLRLSKLLLTPGIYYVTLGIRTIEPDILVDRFADMPLFNIQLSDDIKHTLNRPWGVIHLDDISWHHKA